MNHDESFPKSLKVWLSGAGAILLFALGSIFGTGGETVTTAEIVAYSTLVAWSIAVWVFMLGYNKGKRDKR